MRGFEKKRKKKKQNQKVKLIIIIKIMCEQIWGSTNMPLFDRVHEYSECE